MSGALVRFPTPEERLPTLIGSALRTFPLVSSDAPLATNVGACADPSAAALATRSTPLLIVVVPV